jgi:thiol-disulfide isomerase/thioredoxin
MIEHDIFSNRQEMLEILKENPGVIIIKFGAEWCAPCKKIESFVEGYMNKMPEMIRCIMIDIDNAIDAYSFLKSKKLVNGIPVCLAYFQKQQVTYIPDEVVIGTNTSELKTFFETCYKEVVH